MLPFLDRAAIASMQDQTVRALLDSALAQFYVFTLVFIRLSGLMTVGPIFGQSMVPTNIRVLLILTMALLVTPTIHDHGQIMFHKLDINGDARLTADEVPDSLKDRFEALCGRAGKRPENGLTADEFQLTVQPPRTLLDFAWTVAGEFSLGFVLGIGVMAVLSGLQLAGDLVDTQTGLSLGQIANPMLDTTGGVSGQFLFMFGTTVLLIMPPTGYHLVMVSALVETFQVIPLGEAVVPVGAVDLLRDLVHQSFSLGVQIGAPLLGVMSLVALTMGFLGHSIPQINVLVVGFPVRALLSMSVLMASLSGVARAVVDAIPTAIDQLRQALAGG